MKPQPEWFAGILENRACCHRDFMTTFRATQVTTIHLPAFASTALGATEALRPPDRANVLHAGILGRETLKEVFKVCRTIFCHHSQSPDRTGNTIFATILDIGAGGVNQPPMFAFCNDTNRRPPFAPVG